MGQITGIEWCDHTWNPWRGCAKVSPGCDHCYAEAMSYRNPQVLGEWGEGGYRAIAADSYWRTPYRWHNSSAAAKKRSKVFCGSLMDIWEDHPSLRIPRQSALFVAYQCHWLDWLFLTKRPQNIESLMSDVKHHHYPHEDWWTLQNRTIRYNWWFGCTVEDQERAIERIDVLLSVPAAIRFLSLEPLLASVDIEPWLAKGGIHWVIVGGESNQGGARARPFQIEWVEEIVTQCRNHNVPVFVKQMGSRPLANGLGLRLQDRHGGNWDEWPEWMRVREFPRFPDKLVRGKSETR